MAAGEEVTVVGTYHDNPPRVDSSWSVQNYEHVVHPGTAVTVAGEQRTAVVGLVVHYVVYSADGALYRGLVERLLRASWRRSESVASSPETQRATPLFSVFVRPPRRRTKARPTRTPNARGFRSWMTGRTARVPLKHALRRQRSSCIMV